LAEVEKLSTATTSAIPILSSQLAFSKKPRLCLSILKSIVCLVFLETGLPYVGFGFVDNFVMIVAVREHFYFIRRSFVLFRVKLLKHSWALSFVFLPWQVMKRGL